MDMSMDRTWTCFEDVDGQDVDMLWEGHGRVR